MSKLDTIREVLHEKYFSADQSQLVEKDKDDKGRPFIQSYPIIAERLEYALYRFNPNKNDIFPFFANLSGLKSICDYVLFVEEGKYLYVFLIEMKLSPLSARKQLLAAQEFIHFVVNSSKRIGKELDEHIALRLIRICDSKVKKRKTNEESIIEYDENNYCDYQYKSFRLKVLTHY